MKVLLDECLDRRLARDLDGHDVVTVPQAGWAGVKNGELLRLAQAQFDVFVTVDRNLSFQKNLHQFSIAGDMGEAVASECPKSSLGSDLTMA